MAKERASSSDDNNKPRGTLKNVSHQKGEVMPDTLYTLEEGKSRVGWGNHAFRKAKSEGLKVQYKHGRGYLWGKDLIDYIVEEPLRPEDQAPGQR